jgi:hypothetical protein
MYFWRENFKIEEATANGELVSPPELESSTLPTEHMIKMNRDR